MLIRAISIKNIFLLCSCWNLHRLLMLLSLTTVLQSTILFNIVTACIVVPPCQCFANTISCSLQRLAEVPFVQTSSSHDIWKEFDLSQNFIRHLPPDYFRLIKVRKLNLHYNMIKTLVGDDTFQGLNHTTMMDLSHNHLYLLSGPVFSGMPLLYHLNLSYNRIAFIRNEVFANLRQLNVLDLEENDLSIIPSAAILDLNSLTWLSLRENRIAEVSNNGFKTLTKLTYLDLGKNTAPLKIHRKSFCGLEPRVVHREGNTINWSGLRTLRLDYNGLTSLDHCILHAMWTLTVLDLAGNMVNCDCHVLSALQNSRVVSSVMQLCLMFADKSSFLNCSLRSLENNRAECDKRCQPSNSTNQCEKFFHCYDAALLALLVMYLYHCISPHF